MDETSNVDLIRRESRIKMPYLPEMWISACLSAVAQETRRFPDEQCPTPRLDDLQAPTRPAECTNRFAETYNKQ